MTLKKLQNISSRLSIAKANRKASAPSTGAELFEVLLFGSIMPGILLFTWGPIQAIICAVVLLSIPVIYMSSPGVYEKLSLRLFKARWTKSDAEMLQVDCEDIQENEFLFAAQTYVLEQASKKLDEETLYAFNKLAPNYHGTISELIETSKSLTS